MKRIIAILLSIMIFSSVVYNDTVEVKATSVAVATGAYVTADAIFSLLCTCFILCGIVNAVDDTIDYINMSEAEREVYIENVIEGYETFCDELIAEGTLNDNEYSMAWLILCDANTGSVMGDCQVLADALNEARDNNVDLMGFSLDYTSYDTLKNSSMVWYDDKSSNAIVSPGLMNDICADVVQVISDSTVINKFDKFNFIYGNSEYAINLFSSLQVEQNSNSWVICHYESSNCYRYFPRVTWELCEMYDGTTYAQFKLAKGNSYYDIKPDTSLDYTSNSFTYDIVYSQMNVVAWNNVDTSVNGNISEEASIIDSSNITDSTVVSTQDTFVDKIDSDYIDSIYSDTDNIPVVEDMVIVPPVDNTVENVSDVIWEKSEEGIIEDTAAKDVVDTAIQDISKENEDSIATDIADSLLGTDTTPTYPFVSDGLSNKFPFCIPFDLISAISMLGAEAEAPYIEIPIRNERLGIDEKLVIDFAPFEEVAEVCRITMTVGFVISLILITRKIVKG